MPFANAEDRRRYQRSYYKSGDQKLKRVGATKRWRENRRTRIFKRDGYICFYCQKKKASKDLHLDHIDPANRPQRPDGGGSEHVPGSRNTGTNHDVDYRTACRACNIARSNRPVCSECRSWATPIRHDGKLVCEDCGSLDSFPDGTRAKNDPPEFITEIFETDPDDPDARFN